MSTVATLTGFYAGFFSSDAVKHQQYATRVESDASAVLLRIYLYEASSDLLRQQLLDSNDTAFIASIHHSLEVSEQNIAALQTELEDLEKQLTEIRDKSDASFKNFKPLGFSLILTQLALLLGSISGLLSWKSNWYMGLVLFIFGLAYMIFNLIF